MSWAQLMELDLIWSNRLRLAERSKGLRGLAAFLAHSGDSWFWLLGLLILWLTRAPMWRVLAPALAVGVLSTAVVVLGIKFVVRRRRPEGEWGQIYRKSDPHSFPSGHAARAIMLTVISLDLGPAWFALLLAAWAPLVSLARVGLGLHYLSDVIAGMVLGGVMGFLVLQVYSVWR